MNNKTYITTTLPYVNAAPHIGHALEFIQADALVRFFRKKQGKENVFFNVGMDEHGLKIFQKAQEAGLQPKEYADQYAAKWKEFCQLFNISYDNFYRTSDPEHYRKAQIFWKKCEEKGDIYKKKYEGLYCVGCEEFKTDKDLVDGKCPLHDKEPIQYSEENYFFKLAKYKDQIWQYFESNKDVLLPEYKANELKNFLDGMEDISISRLKENLPWGIPVPGDESQVMYVWFDALTNYVHAVGYDGDENEAKFREWWPGIQLFGPDNLRFQCAIWQGMLASAGIPFTKKFLNHGNILASDGRKMSKTIGNVISPFDQREKYGAEVVRFYMLGILPTYNDSAYKESDLVAHYNANLSNNYGNLLNRTIHLANKKEVKLNLEDKVETEFKTKVDDFKTRIEKNYEEYQIKLACDEINELANLGNKYIDDQKPWLEKDQQKVENVLNNLSYLLKVVINAYEPIIPESCEKAHTALQNQETIILFPKIEDEAK